MPNTPVQDTGEAMPMQAIAIINRRTVLKGSIALAATAHTAVAVAQPEESLPDKATRIAHELADVLNEYAGGRLYATVHPSNLREWPVAFSDNRKTILTPERRIEIAMESIKEAMNEISPGSYASMIDVETRVAMIWDTSPSTAKQEVNR